MTTEYQDEFDQERLAALKPYRTGAGSMSRKAIEDMVNINFCASYGPVFGEKTAAHISIDPVWYYRDLLERTKAIPNVQIRTIRDAIATRPEGDEIIVTLRHDLDGDLIAAKQQAKIEHELGVKSSYYLLHTAPYYAILQNDVFMKNDVSLSDYLEIQALGHELALHTDGMTLYQHHNIDGAVGVETEIKWLRENGCDIRGTTAHNSFGVYGCNNYSIFKNRPLAMSTPTGPKGVLHNGNWAPLQTLDEKELGLEYEANDLFWQDHTPLLYGCLMTQNNWYIAENQYGLLSPETKSEREPLRFRYGTHDDMLDAIANLKGPAYVKLVVHPMHYGMRAGPNEAPWIADKHVDEQTPDGYRIWAGGGPDGTIAGCAVTTLNEFDTPDRGLNCYGTGDFRIAVFGHRNITTTSVGVDSKFSQVMARLVRGPIRKPQAAAMSYANSEGDMQKYLTTFEEIERIIEPDLIVLSLVYGAADFEEKINWAKSLISSGFKVYCLLEGNDLIEKCSNSQAVEIIKAQLACEVFDPSTKFDSYAGSGVLFWHETNIWAPQAHYIVAGMLADKIIEEFRPA